MQQQAGQAGHQTRRATALQRAQSVVTTGSSQITTPTQQVQKVTLQRAVSVDGSEVRALAEGQAQTATNVVQTPCGKTVNVSVDVRQYPIKCFKHTYTVIL